ASVAGGVVASVVGGVTAGVEAGVRSGEIRSLAEVVADGVALGLVLSVVAGVTRQQTIYSIARQIGGAIIGMGVGGVTFSILLVEWALRIGGATLIVSNLSISGQVAWQVAWHSDGVHADGGVV